jgi:hypothetical protein
LLLFLPAESRGFFWVTRRQGRADQGRIEDGGRPHEPASFGAAAGFSGRTRRRTTGRPGDALLPTTKLVDVLDQFFSNVSVKSV